MTLGKQSLDRLATCDDDLQELVHDVANRISAGELAPAGIHDITVLCGFRDKAAQQKAFADGASKLQWPNSKHNRQPAQAVDIAPYPIDWKDVAAFDVLRGFVLARAAVLGIKLRIISWDRPHLELADAP